MAVTPVAMIVPMICAARTGLVIVIVACVTVVMIVVVRVRVAHALLTVAGAPTLRVPSGRETRLARLDQPSFR